ncbi:MAG: helix-turn-helix transcriptional regulator [Acidimicrobiia bacterium]
MAAYTTAAQLGAATRAARLGAGLTQGALAQRAGVSRAWLARFEAGHPAASIEQILLVLKALGLGIELVEPTLRPRDQAIVDARNRLQAAARDDPIADDRGDGDR